MQAFSIQNFDTCKNALDISVDLALVVSITAFGLDL